MATFIVIIIWLLCDIQAAAIAYSKKLNVVAWFFFGAFLGVFGIVAVLLHPSILTEKHRVYPA
jgi:hypothetical protein